jgi:hypothetical protein
MTDFVLEHSMSNKTILNRYSRINNYAKFLKQPLELWMFIPCDENGNVLEYKFIDDEYHVENRINDTKYDEYQQAKERCYFNKCNLRDSQEIVEYLETIEDLVKYNLQLTPTAIKQLGL